jgi:hypothetical protein
VPNTVDSATEQEKWERAEATRLSRQRAKFRKLIQDVMATKNPDHLPSLMTGHMDLLLTMRGYEGATLIEGVLNEATTKGGEEEQVMDAIEYILSFAEVFVDQAHTLDDYNKKLLGSILKTLSGTNNNSVSAKEKEVLLDQLMETEKDNFTPGFLKHVQGECERIAAAPVMTRESSRLLQILLMIQARVLEELGSEIGEEALVLGQLLGYDNAKERMAVLDAGLTVRGVAFAVKMAQLTKEALEGFTRVPCGADPELVERVSEIDSRLEKFMQEQKASQH